MADKIIMEQVDVSRREAAAVELCKGEIPGARPVHHTIPAGQTLKFAGNCGYYHILILIQGKASFTTADRTDVYDTRLTYVPASDADLTIVAETDVQILEIQWDIFPEDSEMLAEYRTEFPVRVPYQDSIQYVDRNKSPKTISRMMIPQRVIPRFSLGSVESYGYDLVKPHSHPMLDQFFFSFPENDMDVLIDGEHIPMGGNMILHIPLGSDHGVKVDGNRHLHYMWIDVMPDQEKGLERLNRTHKPTGLNRSFGADGKEN